MVVEKREDCTLVYDEDRKCLIQQWSGYSGSENFRGTINASIEFFRTHEEVTGLISDTREHKVVKPEDAEWAAKVGNPLLVKYGMRRMAFILPQSLVAQISVDHFSKNSTDQLELKHFGNMEDALEWIIM
jgi:hypothetical protein